MFLKLSKRKDQTNIHVKNKQTKSQMKLSKWAKAQVFGTTKDCDKDSREILQIKQFQNGKKHASEIIFHPYLYVRHPQITDKTYLFDFNIWKYFSLIAVGSIFKFFVVQWWNGWIFGFI